MMLEYEWGIPSSMMHPGEELSQVQDQTHKFFDHYYAAQSFNNDLLLQPVATSSFHRPNTNRHHQLNALYDPSTYADASSYAPPIPCLFALDDPLQIHSFAASGHSYFLVPKTEENVGWPRQDFTARIGLNLGGRTYFSSAGDDFANRLYRRCRPVEPGSSNSPRCQAEGCNADLTHAKHYHRRHKVCEFHSKASTVIAAGLTQRFCQQCSRFHLLSEFDNGKRSCRKRLADHNRRRRKSHQRQPETSENLTVSSPDSGNQNPSSAVTVAVSNPRMFLDCFKQRSLFQCTTSSSASSSSLFFSSG